MEEIISISALNQYVFCPRRCALMHVEGIWSDNEHKAKGTILHKNADERSYQTVREARCLHALPLHSEKYGLNGRADIVEIRADEVVPVEYKKGKIISQNREMRIETNKKKAKGETWNNNAIQLAAQALCLEEMFQTQIRRGFIFHATSKRRREVFFDETLRRDTIATIENVRNLLRTQAIPAADFQPRCGGCSLYGTCLPKLSDAGQRKELIENSACF